MKKGVQELHTEEHAAEYRQYLELIGADENSPEKMQSAMHDLDSVFFDADGEARTDRGIRNGVKAYQQVIKAKIAQLLGNKLFPMHRTDEENFWKSPSTRAKMVQRLLSARTEFQAFTRDDVEQYGEDATIQAVIMDVRKISDTMLRDFGLDKYVPTEKRLPKDRRMEKRAAAIPAIKEFLADRVKPLLYSHEKQQKPKDQKYFRLFRITKGKNEGLVLGIQNDEGERLFLADLHGAFRRVDHIEDSYVQEMKKLHNIKAILRKINERVRADWKGIKGTEKFEELKAELCGIIESLQFVKNKHKKDMRAEVERCRTFEDRRSRINPSSRLAVLVPVDNFRSLRVKQTGKIQRYLTEDKVRIRDTIMEQAGVLADFHDTAEKYSVKLALLDASKPISDVTRQKIVTNLAALKTQCQSFEFEPYLKLAKYVMGEIDTVLGVLNSDQINNPAEREKAKKSFIMIYVVSKLLKLETDLMALRDEFFAPGQKLGNVYVKPLITKVKAIHEEFAAKKVAPEMRIKELGKIFGQVYELLGEIKTKAQQSLGGGAPEAKRVAALKEIDAMLKAFDPYKELQQQLGMAAAASA